MQWAKQWIDIEQVAAYPSAATGAVADKIVSLTGDCAINIRTTRTGVAGDDGVKECHAGVIFIIIDPAAVAVGSIAGKSAVVHSHSAANSVENAATYDGNVAGESAVVHRQRARIIVDAGTNNACIGGESAIIHGQRAIINGDAAALPVRVDSY